MVALWRELLFPWLLLVTPNFTDDTAAPGEAEASVHLQDSRQALYSDLCGEILHKMSERVSNTQSKTHKSMHAGRFELGQAPTTKEAQAIADALYSEFVGLDCDKVELVYTKFVSLISSDPIIQTLLPLTPQVLQLCTITICKNPNFLRLSVHQSTASIVMFHFWKHVS